MKDTSKKAYQQSLGFKETHKDRMMNVFKKYSHQFLDVNDLASLTDLTTVQIHKRLSELERDYLIIPVDETGVYTTYTLVTPDTKKKAIESLTNKRLKAGCKMLLSESDSLPACLMHELNRFNNSLKK